MVSADQRHLPEIRATRRHHFGSFWGFGATTFIYPRASDANMLQLQHQLARCAAHKCPWDSCRLLHVSFSNHKFLTDDIINKTKSTLIEDGWYHDSFSTFKKVLATSPVAGLSDKDLEGIVYVMHDKGTKCLYNVETRQNIEEGKKFVENYLVENHRVPRGDAQRVAREWYDEVVECRIYSTTSGRELDKLSLQGGMMSWWETNCCPALFSSEKIREKDLVNFFNHTGAAIDSTICKVQGMHMIEVLSKDAREWRDTSTTAVSPLSGTNVRSHHGPGSRKPDAVLMNQGDRSDAFQWANFISVMEIKYRYNSKLNSDTISYMGEIARLVLTNQINRRYFVGLSLLGPDLRICIYTRGGSCTTEPIDIYRDVDKYLKIIAWFKHADLELLGYDKSFVGKASRCIEMMWPTASESNPEMLATMIESVIYNSQSGIGRSTRVMGVSYTPSAPTGSQNSISKTEHLICKDVWQNVKLDSDAKIHQLLEDSRRVDKAKLKNDALPDAIEETADEVKLTQLLYGYWSASPEWDADIYGKYPPHLPIRDERFSLDPVMFMDPKTGKSHPDNTKSILWGMVDKIDPLVHLRTFFRTPAVKCTWFSCRREFLHCILGALLGHLEAYRRGILHRDTSDSNVWMWIPEIHARFAVPDWVKEGNGQTKFAMIVVEPEWFPRRPGLAGDFGLALDMLESKSAANEVVTTGTYPFGNTAEAHEAPSVAHDLESYIYLIWLIGVNFKGPYNDVQHWPPPQKRGPIPNNSVPMEDANRLIVEKYGCSAINDCPPSTGVTQIGTTRVPPKREEDKEFWMRQRKIPAWAKMGTYDIMTEDVRTDKLCLDHHQFMGSLQPYWKVGTLCDGWNKLYNLLWPTDSDKRPLEEKRMKLTHARLIAVIREMITAIPAAVDGAPSREVVKEARDRYSASIKRLVDVQMPTNPWLTEHVSASSQELPPSSSNPSQIAPSSSASGPPLTFIHYIPEPQGQLPTTSKMRPSTQRRSGRSGTGSGLQRGRAAPTRGQSQSQSVHSTHRSGQHSGTSHVSTDPSLGSTLAGCHTSGSRSGWSGATQVSDTENENKRRRMS